MWALQQSPGISHSGVQVTWSHSLAVLGAPSQGWVLSAALELSCISHSPGTPPAPCQQERQTAGFWALPDFLPCLVPSCREVLGPRWCPKVVAIPGQFGGSVGSRALQQLDSANSSLSRAWGRDITVLKWFWKVTSWNLLNPWSSEVPWDLLSVLKAACSVEYLLYYFLSMIITLLQFAKVGALLPMPWCLLPADVSCLAWGELLWWEAQPCGSSL